MLRRNIPFAFLLVLVAWAATVLTTHVTFSLAQSTQSKLDMDPKSSRDAIVENHKKRRAQLSKLLGDTKDKVAAHESGEYLLEGDEYETLKKRIGLYEKKLEKMNGPMDDREIDKILERQKIRQERFRHTEL